MNIRAIKQVLSRSLTHCRPWFLLRDQSLWPPSSRSLRFTKRSAFDLGGRKSAKRYSMASYLFDFNSTGLRG